MSLAIRELGPADLDLWARLAAALWPEDSAETHRVEIAELAGPGVGGLRAFAAEDGVRVLGFAQLGLRPYANGCASRPVAFLEGIWVDRRARRSGVGRALVDHVAAAARAEGLSELGSDALVANRISRAAHRGWGFEEIERVVCFRKAL
jgi:aminoglycoside 6'-N-acetyltransferase I